jgi:hypothetical protein
MQVAETYCRDETKKKKTFSLITEVIAELAHHSDAEALIPLIEATEERGFGPKEVLADSLVAMITARKSESGAWRSSLLSSGDIRKTT